VTVVCTEINLGWKGLSVLYGSFSKQNFSLKKIKCLVSIVEKAVKRFLEDGTFRWSRNVGKELLLHAA